MRIHNIKCGSDYSGGAARNEWAEQIIENFEGGLNVNFVGLGSNEANGKNVYLAPRSINWKIQICVEEHGSADKWIYAGEGFEMLTRNTNNKRNLKVRYRVYDWSLGRMPIVQIMTFKPDAIKIVSTK